MNLYRIILRFNPFSHPTSTARTRLSHVVLIVGAFGNFGIIESRPLLSRSNGESEEGGVGRKKKMAVGAAYMRITRGWHGHVAALRLTPCFRHPFPFPLPLSFSRSPFPGSSSVCPVSDVPRPISVPPHLSLFANRKGASRSFAKSAG